MCNFLKGEHRATFYPLKKWYSFYDHEDGTEYDQIIQQTLKVDQQE